MNNSGGQLKVLIIGSDSFIGSNLERIFGQNPSLDVLGIELKGKHSLELDFLRLDDALIQKAISSFLPDVAINASGSANVQKSFYETGRDRELNELNVARIINVLSMTIPTCRLINFSSAAVYGSPTKWPINEQDAENQTPLSPYGKHKYSSEVLLESASAANQLCTVSLRVFSCYGVGQRKLLLWDIYQKLSSSGGKRLELFGTGTETRDYIHIDDLVAATLCVIKNHKFDGSAINIASGRETSIAELARLSVGIISPKAEIVFNGQSREGDPKRWLADISKLNALGFTPLHRLENGIEEYYSSLSNSAL
ncbi:MAG: NAD-dependent epimerase/dehydratase family protein [Flavobacteriales bacterium]